MRSFKFSDLISSNTIDESENLKNENSLACIFGSILMITGAIASFISLFFFMKVSLNDAWPGSLIMLLMGISLIIILLLLKNETVKINLYTAIFSVYLIIVVLIYYSFIGPAVWTIAISLAMISLLYKKKSMLFVISTIILLLIVYSVIQEKTSNEWEFYNAAQVVTFFILFVVIMFLHKTIVSRANKIQEQYNEIHKSEEKLHLTLRSVGDGVIAVDEKGIVEFINPVGQNLTGWNQEKGVGESFEKIFKIINEYTREKVESPIGLVFEKKQIVELANHTILIAKDGTEKPIEDTAAPIIDNKGNITGAVLVFRDFSDKKEKQKQIEYLSYHDQLTGLYNRRFFEEELARLDKKRNLPMSIIYADVNGLKTINDAFGHERGDELIERVADVLKTICRSDDIIARIGGDEFVILLPGTDAESAEKLAIRAMEKIEQRKISDINISVSFGWDTKNEDGQRTLDILKNAEDLMYQKKLLNNASKSSGIIRAIHNALFMKCPRVEAHSKRVGTICNQIGQAYQLNSDKIKELTVAGELHDIGKIAIDEEILNKPGNLSKSELAQIKHHPETGYRLLSTDKEFMSIAEYIFAHHERWDGTGYPKGLKGEAINWPARVIAIAEAYDAMISDYPHCPSLSKEKAIAEIKKNSGSQFDVQIAKVFVEKVLGFEW